MPISRVKILYEYMKHFNRTETKIMFALTQGSFTMSELAEDTGLTEPRLKVSMDYLTKYGMVSILEGVPVVYAFQTDLDKWNIKDLKTRVFYDVAKQRNMESSHDKNNSHQ